MKRNTALTIAGITKHQYYYKPSCKKRGRKPSKTTLKIKGDNVDKISNEIVVQEIRNIQKDPDTNYGYHKMTRALMILGYLINHKKVYQLMDKNQLLKERHKKSSRSFVKYRKVLPSGPLEILEMDIKFIWVEQYRRHALNLTIIDTFTRVVLGRKTGYNIKNELVKQLWLEVIENYLQPYDCLNRKLKIEIRNDNDSRFIALSIQKFFAENEFMQVFTHPYTPQENGHIESFHAILSTMLNRYNFWSLEDLEQCLILFYDKYNNQRLHSSISYLPPLIFWQLWEQKLIETNIDYKKKKIKHVLKIPYHKLSGNMILREVPCSKPTSLDGMEVEPAFNEMNGAVTFLQPSVK